MPEMNAKLEEVLFHTQIEWMDTEEPQVVCDVQLASDPTGETTCGAVLCTVQHNDTLYALVATAISHWNEVHRA